MYAAACLPWFKTHPGTHTALPYFVGGPGFYSFYLFPPQSPVLAWSRPVSNPSCLTRAGKWHFKEQNTKQTAFFFKLQLIMPSWMIRVHSWNILLLLVMYGLVLGVECPVRNRSIRLQEESMNGPGLLYGHGPLHVVLQLSSIFHCSRVLSCCSATHARSFFSLSPLVLLYWLLDCVECMACSDNVVRAGLTPKFKDKATLCSMLDYTMSPSQSRIFAWYSEDDAPQYHVYDPPVPEFTVISVSFSKGQHSLKPRNGPSIVLIVEGQGTLQAEGSKEPISFRRGYVLFMGPNTACSLNAQGDVALYQAVCNSPQ